MNNSCMLGYLLLAAMFFIGGQLIEFIASPSICTRTNNSIDGAFFQTLMSLVAMFWVFIFWDSITEDDWPLPDFTGFQRNGLSHSHQTPRGNDHGSTRTKQGKQVQPNHYQAIRIDKPVGMSINQGVAELNKYKAQFLDKIEIEIWSLIKNSQIRNVTGIVAGGREYRCLPTKDSGYIHRFAAMMRHKDEPGSDNPQLPTYNGEELDSWLSKPIMARVEKLYTEFVNEHSEIRGKIMLEKLRNHPTAYKRVGQQFAKSLQESGEPLTEEMCKALVHIISEQLSNHSMDQLGQQLGHALMHVGGTSAITTFSTSLVQSMGSALGKVMIKIAGKMTFKTAMKTAGKKIAWVTFTGVVSTCAALGGKTLALKGFGLAAAIVSHGAILIIIGVVAAMEAHKFTGKVADKIAPEVRNILAGRFESNNRSMLEMVGKDFLKDGAIQLGKTLALDSKLVEHSKEAAKEIVKAKIPALRNVEF